MKKLSLKIQALLITLLLTSSLAATAQNQTTEQMFGIWGSLTLQGDFTAISEDLNDFSWLIMNQSRTRDDSPDGSRFTENLLFAQLGYQLNKYASIWLGYTHDWIHPLNKASMHENRAYQDFVWNQEIQGFKLLSRTRMEQRINQSNNDTGYRARQFIQISHPLSFAPGLSTYIGDEVFFYLNKNNFGKQGFTENRVLGGLSYQLTEAMGFDLGYLGQFINSDTGNDLFTHNLQANLRYKF